MKYIYLLFSLFIIILIENTRQLTCTHCRVGSTGPESLQGPFRYSCTFHPVAFFPAITQQFGTGRLEGKSFSEPDYDKGTSFNPKRNPGMPAGNTSTFSGRFKIYREERIFPHRKDYNSGSVSSPGVPDFNKRG